MQIKEILLTLESWFNEQFACFFTNGMKSQQNAHEELL